MAVRLSVVETVVSPSFRTFWLHCRGQDYLEVMTAAAGRTDAEDVGFAGSAVAVRTVTDAGSVRVTVEIWSRQPMVLSDEPRFEYAVEGELELPAGQWCIDESHDSGVQAGVSLPGGAGRYGVRVTAYNQQRVTDLIEEYAEDFVAAMAAVRALPAAEGERYRLQLWPVGRGR
ncbi:hypothetical protein [Dactylosporangium sp. NPDC051541]|uniref:hypothetical protein n=1 Tax=Dactylosporangium sp. NPDC051541 TaxID=3363977 RepID=UPI0037B8CA53